MDKKVIQTAAFMNKTLRRYAMLIEGDFEHDPGVFKRDIIAIIYPSGLVETFKTWGTAIEFLERGGLKEVTLQDFPNDVSASIKNTLDKL